MCGITGIFDTLGTRPISRTALSRMNAAHAHRGPDAGNVHLAPGIGLGHRRLAVIDLETGQQPMFNEDGSLVVVCNGEIYNYQQLMQELRALGHVFRTQSDTEVIVHAWEAWGPQCVQRFRGMFAFVLWDRTLQTLFMARDRLGVKPLYYAFLNNGLLLFGSELKSLLAHGNLSRQMDPLAVEEYFALGYVAEPHTIFKAASKLPPGHTLTVRRSFPAPEPKAYWDVRFTQDNFLKPEEAQDELVHRLRESVRLRMQADVPLGAFLSGGVDSSAVVALMAGLSSAPIITCSIGFAEAAFDETEYAQQVALRYLTDHHREQVSMGPEDAVGMDLIDTLARLFDEPFADSSAIPTWRVCQLARRHVTVALSGDGADESFAGYTRYRQHQHQEGLRRALPLWLRRPMFGLMGSVLPKPTFDVMASDSVQAYLHTVSVVKAPQRRALFSDRLKQQLGGYSALEVFRRHASAFYALTGTNPNPLALVQYLDLKTYLVGDINTKVDRTSMAHALEVREPMMDHELVQWLATLPSTLHVDATHGKLLLKKAMEPYLPHDLLYRRKMGFAVPLAAWLRGPLRQRLQDAVLGQRLLDTGWFERRALQQLVDAHLSGSHDHSSALWSLLMFEAFLRQVVDVPSNAQHAFPPPGLEVYL
jgi:asparagine synthase (glutamine-hydrolysing)